MAILTYSGRTLFAEFLVTRPLYLAIGKGKTSWDTTPEAPDYEDTDLVSVIGYKKLTRSFFVNEDDNGEIDLPGGRFYSASETPTRHVCLEFQFKYGEAVDVEIREVGIFADTTIKGGLPSNQTYFTPSQVVTKGTLITLEHLEAPDTFTPNKKGCYRTVLTI